MSGDYEEMEPVEDAGGFPAVAVAVVLTLAFVWLLALGAGCATGADPVAAALADLRAEKAVRAALAGPKAAPPARVVIVPGRWELGGDGLWRFYPSEVPKVAPPDPDRIVPDPNRNQPGMFQYSPPQWFQRLQNAAPESAAPRPFYGPDPSSTPTTPVQPSYPTGGSAGYSRRASFGGPLTAGTFIGVPGGTSGSIEPCLTG